MNELSAPDKDLLEGATELDLAKVRRAIDAGANPAAQDWMGRTALLRLIDAYRKDKPFIVRQNIMEALLAHGANPNATEVNEVHDDRLTILHKWVQHASGLCRGEVRTLLNAGADVHAKDRFGRTPLDLAMPVDWKTGQINTRTGHLSPDIVTLLLEAGADPHHRAQPHWPTPAEVWMEWGPDTAGPVLAQRERRHLHEAQEPASPSAPIRPSRL